MSELSRVSQVAAIPDEVCGIEQVEDFTVQDEAPLFEAEREGPAQPKVLREVVVIERKVGW